jgi:hypothetical protein
MTLPFFLIDLRGLRLHRFKACTENIALRNSTTLIALSPIVWFLFVGRWTLLYHSTWWKLQAKKCVTELKQTRKVQFVGREIKLIPCTIPELIVFCASQFVIKLLRVLTKDRAGFLFLQQSHLNAMKCWDWKNCYVRDTQLLRNWRIRSDMNLCWLAKHSSYATLVHTSVVRRKWGI